jgi:hypothetical protein
LLKYSKGIDGFMFNLRSQHFQQIEEIYKDIESLTKLCNLSGIKRKLSSLFNYSASNDKFTACINFAVNQLNSIINFFANEWGKPKLIELYNKLVSLLPSDLQLELPLDVKITEPISKIKKKKIAWIQKYLWKQLTLSDIFLLPEIEIGIWENDSRRF